MTRPNARVTQGNRTLDNIHHCYCVLASAQHSQDTWPQLLAPSYLSPGSARCHPPPSSDPRQYEHSNILCSGSVAVEPGPEPGQVHTCCEDQEYLLSILLSYVWTLQHEPLKICLDVRGCADIMTWHLNISTLIPCWWRWVLTGGWVPPAAASHMSAPLSPATTDPKLIPSPASPQSG